MPTQAVAAYGSELRLSNDVPIPGIGVSGATNTTPIVLTTAPHGIPVGDVSHGTVSGVGGNLGANGDWVLEALSTTTLRLRGSIGTGAYTSGGGIVLDGTFTKIAELINLEPLGMTFRMVDVSAHDGGGWSSSIPTQKEGPAIRVTINLVPDHVTHDKTTGLIFLALGKVRRNWLVVFPQPSGRATLHFLGWITAWTSVTPVDGALRATPTLTPDGRVFITHA